MFLGEHFPLCPHSACANVACLQSGYAMQEAMENTHWRTLFIMLSWSLRSPGISQLVGGVS